MEALKTRLIQSERLRRESDQRALQLSQEKDLFLQDVQKIAIEKHKVERALADQEGRADALTKELEGLPLKLIEHEVI